MNKASTSTVSSSDSSTSILVIHGPTLDPLPFLQRLKADPKLDLETSNLWTIDNKYYTAQVHFHVVELRRGQDVTELDVKGIPVVLYLFTQRPPDPLPSVLTEIITSEPRDILLAIRVKSEPSTKEAENGHQEGAMSLGEWDTVEEAFAELGMELVDEQQLDEEYTMDPLEEARMTIMAHMWPNMVRKPLGTRTAVDLELGNESGESEYEDEREGEVGDEVDFPVFFNQGGPSVPAVQGDGIAVGLGHERYRDSAEDSFTTDLTDDYDDAGSHDQNDNEDHDDPLSLYSKSWAGYTSSSRTAAQSQFPALQALNRDLGETTRLFAQLKVEREMAEERRLERLGRLEKDLELDSDDDLSLDEEGIRFGSGPDEGEWERLEDWLEDEGEVLEGEEGGLEGDEQEALDALAALRIASLPESFSPNPDQRDITNSSLNAKVDSTSGPHTKQKDNKEGFEDDFADFHSAPPTNTSSSSSHGTKGPRLRLNKNGIPAELPPDPTPLLLHLQSVRAELAGIGDEDERRVRAAEEVMAVLGLRGVEDWGLDERG